MAKQSALRQAREQAKQQKQQPISNIFLELLKQGPVNNAQHTQALLLNLFKTFLNQSQSNPTQPSQKTEAPSRDMIQLQVLKQNMLDQTPYTPQAQEEINNMTLEPYGIPLSSSEANRSGAWAHQMQMGVNRNTLNLKGKSYPVKALRHEVLHNLDDNMYRSSAPISFGNSMNFAQLLQKKNPEAYARFQQIFEEPNGIYNPENIRSKDMESFAYTGDMGPRVLIHQPLPIAQQFSNIYIPMSKAIRYSPVYPSQDFLQYQNSRYNKPDMAGGGEE